MQVKSDYWELAMDNWTDVIREQLVLVVANTEYYSRNCFPYKIKKNSPHDVFCILVFPCAHKETWYKSLTQRIRVVDVRRRSGTALIASFTTELRQLEIIPAEFGVNRAYWFITSLGLITPL